MIINLPSLKQTFLQQVMKVMVGSQQIKFYETVNWENAIKQFELPELTYPSYYTLADFHGIKGGYLNPIAAITYDIVTPLATPPNEQWIRQGLLKVIKNKPQRILDLGCGTGSNTILLKRKFPEADIIGLDLSPYLLLMAQQKAHKNHLDISWQHGLAESTKFASASFDLITLSMVLHETPSNISQLILQESFRLLKPGGQIINLDANQKRLRKVQWLIKLFKEPYSAIYAQGDLKEWLDKAGFQEIVCQPIWWIYQVTYGIKT